MYKFTIPKFRLVTKVGKYGTGAREFKYPRYLSVTTDRSVLVADWYNDRIVVKNTDLKLKHQSYKRSFVITEVICITMLHGLQEDTYMQTNTYYP